jgi:sulfatase maturation enzyme AslB (radical SAM superfamily)
MSDETIPFSILDRIITEKTELWGSHYTTWVGGEPTVYRSEGKDILDMAERHADNMFLMFTNATLIDKPMARRMAELGNIVPQVSVEGFEKETDGRRGKGVFKRILKAFENMRETGVAFGIAVTPMRHNYELLTSEEFIPYSPNLPFTSSGIPDLKLRFSREKSPNGSEAFINQTSGQEEAHERLH